MEAKKISEVSEIASIADDDYVPAIDISGATPAAKGVRATMLKIATYVLAKYATVSKEEAEARTATTVRWWTAERVGQAIAAAIAGLSSGAQHKWDATAAPTGTDDTTQGYSQGSLWRWALRVWICVDASTNVAKWVEITGSGGDLVSDTTPQLGGALDTNDHQIRESIGNDVASSAALALGDDGNRFTVTGTTTITSINTLAVGTKVTLRFAGILTLTHHSTNLILPTAANITTAVGDVAVFREYAEGDWECESYQRAAGTALSGGGGGGGGIENIVEDTSPQLGGPLDANAHQIREAKGADVASAAELPLLADGNYFSVTGTTTITSLAALAVGTRVTLRFAGVLTLTHHASDLILPTAANITTAAGDVAVMREYAAGDWVCESYQRADGTPLSGGSGGGAPGPLALVDHSSTSGRALTLADANKLHSGWTGTGEGSLPIELTVPQQSVVPWPVGTVLWFRHTDLGDWDFTVASGTSVSGADLTIAVNETVALAMIATNTWTVLYRWSSGA